MGFQKVRKKRALSYFHILRNMGLSVLLGRTNILSQKFLNLPSSQKFSVFWDCDVLIFPRFSHISREKCANFSLFLLRRRKI